MAGKASVFLFLVLPAVLGAPVISQQETLTKPAELSEPDFSGLSCIRIDHVEQYSITLVDFCPEEEVDNGRCYCNSVLAPGVINREVEAPEAVLGTRYGQGGWASSPGTVALASSSDATSPNTDLSDTDVLSAPKVKVTVETPEKVDVEVIAAENNEVKGDEVSEAAPSAGDQTAATVTVADTRPVGSGLGRYKKIVSDDGTVILQFYDDMPRDVISAICRAEFERADRVEGCGEIAA